MNNFANVEQKLWRLLDASRKKVHGSIERIFECVKCFMNLALKMQGEMLNECREGMCEPVCKIM